MCEANYSDVWNYLACFQLTLNWLLQMQLILAKILIFILQFLHQITAYRLPVDLLAVYCSLVAGKTYPQMDVTYIFLCTGPYYYWHVNEDLTLHAPNLCYCLPTIRRAITLYPSRIVRFVDPCKARLTSSTMQLIDFFSIFLQGFLLERKPESAATAIHLLFQVGSASSKFDSINRFIIDTWNIDIKYIRIRLQLVACHAMGLVVMYTYIVTFYK